MCKLPNSNRNLTIYAKYFLFEGQDKHIAKFSSEQAVSPPQKITHPHTQGASICTAECTKLSWQMAIPERVLLMP